MGKSSSSRGGARRRDRSAAASGLRKRLAGRGSGSGDGRSSTPALEDTTTRKTSDLRVVRPKKPSGGKGPIVNEALQEELARLGRPVTPQELSARGVRRLVSVDKSEVSRLIEKSVNRTLLERTIGGLSEEERRLVVREAQDQLDAELGAIRDLSRSKAELERQKDAIRAELEGMQGRIQSGRGFVEHTEGKPGGVASPAEVDERLEKLRKRVQARLLPIFDHVPRGGPTVRRVAGEILEMFREEHVEALHAQRRELEGETQQLSRRLTKLMRGLERTEAVLARVSKMKSIDVGVESIYREVQGLQPEDEERELKQAMMEDIFQANLQLQQKETG